MPYSYTLIALVLVSLLLYALYSLYSFGQRDKRLPPGPPTTPILGNAHQIPTGLDFHKKFKQWGDQYGSIYSLKIGARTMIVLNSKRAVHDLLDKRSAIYSDRPIDQQWATAFRENLAFMDVHSTWRAQRKLASHMLAPRSLDENIMSIQEAETNQLVYDLLMTPENFFAHVQRVTASVASIVIFGFRAPKADSFWARCVYKAMDQINHATTPGSYLPIAEFPILNYIPSFLTPSRARAKECFDAVTSIWTRAYSEVVARRQNGDERHSLTDRLLSGQLKSDVEMTTTSQIANFLGALHQGAADTTSNMMLSGIMQLVKAPWVQEKAQAEIDRVCGDGRSPTWHDFTDLPYVNCIVKENLRLNPVLPSGIPTRVSRDDYFDGFLIPKDSTIFCPSYGMNRINDAYPEPEKFNPDRYLNHPLQAMAYAGSPDYENRDHYTYGTGRRICVGIHLAERTQFRLFARLLWAFDIKPALDEKGAEIEVDADAYKEGIIISPKPFSVRFVPRSEKRTEVIKHEYEQVKNFLQKWE